MEVKTATAQVEKQRAVLTELLMADQPDEDPKETTTGDNLLLDAGAPLRDRPRRAAAPGARARRGPLQPGHQRQPRRVHPVRSLRPRLRRHPGQRRHRPQRQGLRDAHRVRPERPDGRVDVRDLRRVRRRMPDRRAGQQADPRRADPAARGAQVGRLGLPVLRRRLRADLPRGRGARRDRLRRRPRPARQPEPPVREGPLRLGLRRVQAAPDDAADPRDLPQGGALRATSRARAAAASGRAGSSTTTR